MWTGNKIEREQNKLNWKWVKTNERNVVRVI